MGAQSGALREIGPDKETIYYSYVVESYRKLIGFGSLKALILAPGTARDQEIMHGEVISVPIVVAKLKLNPAVVASSVLATLVDISGLLIYFMMAKLLLGI
jgi:Mg/Co/Ni transporter MgtE